MVAVIERRPGSPVFRNNLGNLMTEAGRAAEAAIHLREAVRMAPQLPEAHFNLGNALKALDRLDEAIAAYSTAITLRPAFTKARINLSGVFVRREQYEEALRNYDEAIRLDPASAELRDARGVALQSIGRIDEGLESFRQALDVNPQFAGAHRNAGLALLMSGDFKAGWAEYEWRWQADLLKDTDRKFPVPAWQGERDPGGIVVWGEQGIGDRVLYAGMIPSSWKPTCGFARCSSVPSRASWLSRRQTRPIRQPPMRASAGIARWPIWGGICAPISQVSRSANAICGRTLRGQPNTARIWTAKEKDPLLEFPGAVTTRS